MHLPRPRHCYRGRGKAFDNDGGVPFHEYGTCGRAMRIVTHFERLVPLLCLPFGNVDRELQRFITIIRFHGEQKKLTTNPQQREESTAIRTMSPSLPYIILYSTVKHIYFECEASHLGNLYSTQYYIHIQ